MNKKRFNQLLEQTWKSNLNDQEKDEISIFLEGHPDQKALWEEESQLNQLLDQLPEPSVSSHFTQTVVNIVSKKTSAQKTTIFELILDFYERLTRKPALGFALAATLAISGIMIQQNRRQLYNDRMANSISTLSGFTGLAKPKLAGSSSIPVKSNPAIQLAENNLLPLNNPEILLNFETIDALSYFPTSQSTDLDDLVEL
ncbi:MAG TPA: hypothetical protein EYQ50_07060 [Verrucomicrobiales bacterium]|nr:hypothetical protein [Verrucomicrobiales bacterium]HIL69891.1 hypothetical protein [Verrucomicrobiota bacterium]